MKIKKTLALLLVLCIILTLCPTFAFAQDTAVTLSCSTSAIVGSTVAISGTAQAGAGISIKIMDSSGNIVYFDVVKATTNGTYSNSFIPSSDLVGKTLSVVAGYGDNVATQALTINATQTLSSDATLSGLTLKNGTISFASTAYSYSVSVDNSVDSITVTPTASDSGAKITVNNTAVASGSASNSISLTAGANTTITVYVISADQSKNETYTIIVYRASSGTGTGSSSSGGSSGGGSSTSGGTTGQSSSSTTGNSVTTTTSATTTVDSGKASSSVTSSQVSDAVTKALSDAASKGSDTKAVVEIKVTTTDTSVKSAETSIPKDAISNVADKGIAEVKVSTPVADITLDESTIKGIATTAQSDVKISATTVDNSTLSSEVQQKVGDRPVYNFSITSGDNTISTFTGNVTVSVPYTPKSGEDTNSIVVYYVNAKGELETVKGCTYDSTTGKVSFKTTHFSNYVIGYNKVSFTDVSGWYQDYVSYLSARGIINGKGEGEFAPLANITRAEFAQILANMSGADLSTYNKASFSDVSTSDWYCNAVEWAYENGVVLGNNGNYNPNSNITRQDMAVMISRYSSKIANYTLPETALAVAFSDQSSISSYASDAVSAMQKAGIISGKGGNIFDPTANATRAETSKMIAVLMQGMSK